MTTYPPLGVQLYSVRDALQTDFRGTLERLKAIGYQGVEFAGVYGESPASAASLCADLGLRVTSAHQPLAIGDALQQVVETAQALGTNLVVCPWQPPARFQAFDTIAALCDELNTAAQNLAPHGLRLAYHNHDFEFKPVPGIGVPYDVMLQHLSPQVYFELDSYWIKVGQSDAAAVIREAGSRAVLIHLKDGTGEDFRAIGTGYMDMPAVLAASTQAEWLIAELDSIDGDMLDALTQSYQYLASQGVS